MNNNTSIHFMWDMNQQSIDMMHSPLPDNPLDVCDYMGAVFFGKFKLEFIRNDVAGVYCNLFEYGAEDDPGHAYAYLEDGTPYEERYPVSDEISVPDIAQIEDFTNNIQDQIIQMIDMHPEFLSSASQQIDPNDWYPCNHSYKVTVTKESQRRITMKNTYSKAKLFSILDTISEYHPDIRPLRKDSMENLLEKYFYWVDEYNDGYDPRHIRRN